MRGNTKNKIKNRQGLMTSGEGEKSGQRESNKKGKKKRGLVGENHDHDHGGAEKISIPRFFFTKEKKKLYGDEIEE